VSEQPAPAGRAASGPGSAPVGGSLARLAVGFGRALRLTGLEVPVSAVAGFAQALEAVGLGKATHAYWAGHALFVRRPEDVPLYASAFAAFFGAAGLPARLREAERVPVSLLTDDAEEAAEETPGEDARAAGEVVVVRYSATEMLRRKDFAALGASELAEAYAMIARLRASPARRPSRRRRPVSGSRGVLDLRRTMREALRAGGEPVHLHRLARGERPRRIVLLVDVSGSMELYAKPFLRLAHAVVVARGGNETFTFGTRLTRVTRELRWRDPDGALERASGAVVDIAGGTRLGASLRAFNDRFGVSGTARGAYVVVLSDGWDRGDPDELREEMARLARVAHRVVWVNPLKATPGYAPLARGMAAALPYVDEFVEGHSVASLERLVEVLSR
jgi:uncharacterized protein with von Willebrand factor type A (vWA) domain